MANTIVRIGLHVAIYVVSIIPISLMRKFEALRVGGAPISGGGGLTATKCRLCSPNLNVS